MAYNNEEEIAVVRRGAAIELQMMIPPGIAGHSVNTAPKFRHDPRWRIGYSINLDIEGERTATDPCPTASHCESGTRVNATPTGATSGNCGRSRSTPLAFA
jgi:hypothetical protein